MVQPSMGLSFPYNQNGDGGVKGSGGGGGGGGGDHSKDGPPFSSPGTGVPPPTVTSLPPSQTQPLSGVPVTVSSRSALSVCSLNKVLYMLYLI